MKNIYKLILGVLILACTGYANAQTVSGTVTDAADGTGLPGVNVLEKGTTNGTVTDFDGNYRLDVSDNAILVFSFVGYSTQEVEVGSRTVIDVQLDSDIKQLSEIVVVGYGTQEVGDVTGSIAKVSEESFNQGVIISPDNLIAGKVPGVQITPNSGEPGGQVQIRIRGGTSINGTNEPLFVIDGVIIDNDATNPGNLSQGRNPLNFLNPNNIADITVLKDASAAAIYGSRAANGVIVITTKSGGKGGPTFEYNGWASVGNAIETVPVLTGPEFRELVELQNPAGAAQLANANTDFQSEILQQAIGQNHEIAFSGGDEKGNFRASIGYLDQQGVVRTSNSERISYSLNYQQKLINDDLNVRFTIKGARTQDRFSPGVIGAANSFAPTQPIFDPNGFAGFFEFDAALAPRNPLATLALTDERGTTYRNQGNISFDYSIPWEPLSGLSATVNLGFDIENGLRERFIDPNLRSQIDVQTPASSALGVANLANFDRENVTLDAYFTYKRDFLNNDLSFELTGGYSFQDFNGQFNEFGIDSLTSSLFGSSRPDLGNLDEVSLVNSFTNNTLISGFGRINLGYKDRYLLSASFRRDGSDRFGPQNRFGSFGAVSAGWRISEEPFFSNLTNVFDDLKLRVGWGLNGQQDGIDEFGFLPLADFANPDAVIPLGGEVVTPIRVDAFDPFLQWEETESFNVGLDYGFLEGRLSGSVEYYYKFTDELLFEIPAPVLAFAQDQVLTNIGSVINEGVELALNGVVFDTDDFSWNVNFNLAYNTGRVDELFGDSDPNFNGIATGDIAGGTGQQIQRHLPGQRAFTFFARRHLRNPDGTPVTDTFIDENGVEQTRPLIEIFDDIDGDGAITDDDLVASGSPLPDITYGLTSNAYYKNFDLSFTLRAATGVQVYNNIAAQSGSFAGLNAATPANVHRSALVNNFSQAQLLSDIYVEDSDFLRMDNITLGYRIPSLPEGLGIRVYSTIQNLFVISGYSGLDPEAGASGIDNDLFPRSRTFVFGINVSL